MNELGHLFSADPVAHQLFFGPRPNQNPIAPEKELMLAVLADAVECFCKYAAVRDAMGTRLFREAHEWLFSDDDEQPFSFVNVCDALNLDPSYIRRGLIEWKWRTRRQGWNNKKTGQRDFSLKNVKRKLKKISRAGRLASGAK